jgi:hypothetical protein
LGLSLWGKDVPNQLGTISISSTDTIDSGINGAGPVPGACASAGPGHRHLPMPMPMPIKGAHNQRQRPGRKSR